MIFDFFDETGRRAKKFFRRILLDEQPTHVSVTWHENATVDGATVRFLVRKKVALDSPEAPKFVGWLREQQLQRARADLNMPAERLRSKLYRRFVGE